jgi:hypothetical protein
VGVKPGVVDELRDEGKNRKEDHMKTQDKEIL